MKYSAKKFLLLMSLYGPLIILIAKTTDKFKNFADILHHHIFNLDIHLQIYDELHYTNKTLYLTPKYASKFKNEHSIENIAVMIFLLLEILNDTYFGSSYDENGEIIFLSDHISIVDYLCRCVNYSYVNAHNI